MDDSSSSLAYQPYAAIVATLNAQRGEGSEKARKDFRNYVQRVHYDLHDGWRRYKSADTADDSPGGDELDREEILRFLYRTTWSHDAFGFADVVCLTLIDDLDQYFQLTSSLNLPIKQVSLNFCPKLDSLGLVPAGDEFGLKTWKLNGIADRRLAGQGQFFHLHETPQDGDPLESLFGEYPLLLYTQYKLGTLSGLGPGILMLREILCALANKVVKAQQVLLDAFEDKDLGPVLNELEITPETIRNLKVAILNPQGPEEIATYTLCSNYSVAVFVTQYIASMTIGDVVGQGDSLLRRLIGNSRLHCVLSKLADRDPAEDELLEANHVFADTYGVLGAHRNAYNNPQDSRIYGCIEAYPRLDFLAGHINEVDKTVWDLLHKASHEIVDFDSSRVLRFLVGRNDYDYDAAWSDDNKPNPIRLKSFFGISRELEQKLVEDKETTPLTNISSSIVVPVPRKIPKVDYPAHAAIPDATERLAQQLFDQEDELSRHCETLFVPTRLARSISHLMKNYADSIKEPFLLPSVLDLSDPFQTVHRLLTEELDRELHERMACVPIDDDVDEKDLIVRELVGRTYFSQDRIEQLGYFVNSLHHAHSYRIHRQTKEEIHDWAIDIRGSLMQLVQGATAVSLCGAGLTKWGWANIFGAESLQGYGTGEADDDHSRSGVVVRLSLSHPSRFKVLDRVSDSDAILVVNTFSVGHVVHPLEFVDHLHEAAHLVLQETDAAIDPTTGSFWLPGPCQRFVSDNYRGSSFTPTRECVRIFLNHEEVRDIRDELFANLLVHLFVFGADYKTARRYLLWRFDVSPRAGKNDQETADMQIEYAWRVFIVTEAVKQMRESGGEDMSKWGTVHHWRTEFDNNVQKLRDDDEALEVLTDTLREEFCSEETKQWVGAVTRRPDLFGAALSNVDQFFEHRIKMCLPVFDDVWRRAIHLYQAYWKHGESDTTAFFPWRDDKGVCLRKKIEDALTEAMKKGESSMVDTLVSKGVLSADQYDYESIDPLGLVCYLLHACAQVQLGDFSANHRNHLIREPRSNDKGIDGPPNFNAPPLHDFDRRENGLAKPWGKRQIDPRRVRIFSCDPSERAKLLQIDIAFHRMLWDLSTRLRCRRAVRLAERVLIKK